MIYELVELFNNMLNVFRPLRDEERLPVLEHRLGQTPVTTKTKHSKKKDKVSFLILSWLMMIQ